MLKETGKIMRSALVASVTIVFAIVSAFAISGLAQDGSNQERNVKVDRNVVNLNQQSPQRKDKVVKTDQEWQKSLTPEQYKILRKSGTEPAFCGINLEHKGEGTYHCVGCDLPLFKATNKFNSGSGWPSFYEPFDVENVWYHTDRALGMVRTEILCARCDGHLGHVFDDGPPPTHLRYCINGTVLKFVAKKD